VPLQFQMFLCYNNMHAGASSMVHLVTKWTFSGSSRYHRAPVHGRPYWHCTIPDSKRTTGRSTTALVPGTSLPTNSATICVYQILHTSAVLYKFHILPLLIVMTVFIHKFQQFCKFCNILQILQYSAILDSSKPKSRQHTTGDVTSNSTGDNHW